MCPLIRLCVCFSALAMEFHEKLQSLAAKEGLKGRKVSRALESFSWNITILKVRNTHSQKPKQPKGVDHYNMLWPLASGSFVALFQPPSLHL